MNKQTLKRYYKGAKSSLINGCVKIDNEFYITNDISIMNLKEFNQNWINMPSLEHAIKKYVENFKGGKFRALDLENYNQTCDLIHFVKNKECLKNHAMYDLGNKFSVDLKMLKTCCDLIHATNVSILDLEEEGHPVIYINNRKTGAFGWLLPCRVY